MTGCYAKGCKNASAKGCKMSFFPKDPTRRAQWTDSCKKNNAITYALPNNHSALCEFHFKPEMWEKVRVDGTKKLRCHAVPTIFGKSVKQIDKEIEKKGKKKANVPPVINKTTPLQTIFLCTKPNTNNLQILTQPISGQYLRIVPINVQGSTAIKPSIVTDVPKGKQETKSTQLQPIASKNLLSNNNVEIIEIIDDTNLQNGTQQVQEYEISESHLKADEDSDSDSFIANNFEPVSDDEPDLTNFEPVSDSEMIISDPDASDTDIQDAKAQARIDTIVYEESQLYHLEEKFKSACETVKPCNRCEKLEKVYDKCNSIRIMMKKRHKANHGFLKRRIKFLENQILTLQSNQLGLKKIFNEDQIDFLSRDQKKIWKWSLPTLEKARQYKRQLGMKGYQLLLDHNWPLPSLRTLRNRGTKVAAEQPNVETVDYLTLEYSD